MIDRGVLDLEPWQAVAISVAGLALGWIVYDLLCRSPLGRNDTALAAVGLVFLTLLAWGFAQVFSGRGAFMQMGALIGTHDGRQRLLRDHPRPAQGGGRADRRRRPGSGAGPARQAALLHNNYLTLPVIFVMIGNHYPLAFASRWSWAILAIVLIMGAVIRHFFNEQHKGAQPLVDLGGRGRRLAAIVWLSAEPASEAEEARADTALVEEIMLSRCSMCHAAEPVWEGIALPPKGVVLETPEQIRRQARAIDLQAVRTRAMPPGNITFMEEERRALAA